MRHVDDGTIHAWLDHQVTDPSEVAWIEQHLHDCGECGARLAAERATLEQASALLAAVAPVADGGRAAFDALAARAAGPAPASRFTASRRGPMLKHWLMPASWAASLALAAAIGWTVRDLAPANERRDDGERTRQATELPRATGEISPKAAPAAATETAATPKPIVRAKPDSAQPKMRAQQTPASLPPAGSAAPPIAGTTPAQPVPQAAPPPVLPSGSIQLLPPTPPPSVFTQPAATGQLGAARGGGRGGGGGGRFSGAGRGFGRLTVDGIAAAAPVVTGAVDRVERRGWRTLPRTEAAALSGMALYGIEGLTSVETLLSADATAVRTTYRLDTGETVEVIQEKVMPETVVVAEAPVVDFQNARTASGVSVPLGAVAGTVRQEATIGAPVVIPQEWSTRRGDVKVTLRGGPNPEELGARLRID